MLSVRRPVSLRPMTTRERAAKRVIAEVDEDDSSESSGSGDEWIPAATTVRRKRYGRASDVVKKALRESGLVKTEEILEKARLGRTESCRDPIVSYEADCSEFVDCDKKDDKEDSGNILLLCCTMLYYGFM